MSFIHKYGKKRNSDLSELRILQKTYDMMLYAHGRLVQFPRYEKDSLARKIKDIMYDMIDLIIETNCEEDKGNRLQLLYELNMELEKLRFFIKFSSDNELRYLSIHQYETWTKKLDEIGKMLGRWIKSVN